MYLYARSVRRPPYPIYLYARSASRPPYPIYLYAGSASRPPCPIYLCAGSVGRPPYPIYLCAVRMKTNLVNMSFKQPFVGIVTDPVKARIFSPDSFHKLTVLGVSPLSLPGRSSYSIPVRRICQELVWVYASAVESFTSGNGRSRRRVDYGSRHARRVPRACLSATPTSLRLRHGCTGCQCVVPKSVWASGNGYRAYT